MNKTTLSSFIFYCCSICFLSMASLASHAQTLKYQYDAQGRVTFIEDATNGNRDYDYDSAGNRVLVTVGTSSDLDSEPSKPFVMPAPTGLSCSGYAQGAWKGKWNPVAGAAYYIYRTTSPYPGAETQETSTETVKSASCKWVQACNVANICSAKSNF